MTTQAGDGAEPNQPRADEQQDVRWDVSGARSSYCTIASTSVAPQQVVVNFGVPRSREGAPGELEAQSLHRIAISPTVASHLRQLLARLLAEHEAR